MKNDDTSKTNYCYYRDYLYITPVYHSHYCGNHVRMMMLMHSQYHADVKHQTFFIKYSHTHTHTWHLTYASCHTQVSATSLVWVCHDTEHSSILEICNLGMYPIVLVHPMFRDDNLGSNCDIPELN